MNSYKFPEQLTLVSYKKEVTERDTNASLFIIFYCIENNGIIIINWIVYLSVS